MGDCVGWMRAELWSGVFVLWVGGGGAAGGCRAQRGTKGTKQCILLSLSHEIATDPDAPCTQPALNLTTAPQPQPYPC